MYYNLSANFNFRSDNAFLDFNQNWIGLQSFSFQAISLCDFGGENEPLATNEWVRPPINSILCCCNFSGLVIVCICHLELITFDIHVRDWAFNANHNVITLQLEPLSQFHLEFWHLARSLFLCFNVWGNTLSDFSVFSDRSSHRIPRQVSISIFDYKAPVLHSRIDGNLFIDFTKHEFSSQNLTAITKFLEVKGQNYSKGKFFQQHKQSWHYAF